MLIDHHCCYSKTHFWSVFYVCIDAERSLRVRFHSIEVAKEGSLEVTCGNFCNSLSCKAERRLGTRTTCLTSIVAACHYVPASHMQLRPHNTQIAVRVSCACATHLESNSSTCDTSTRDSAKRTLTVRTENASLHSVANNVHVTRACWWCTRPQRERRSEPDYPHRATVSKTSSWPPRSQSLARRIPDVMT